MKITALAILLILTACATTIQQPEPINTTNETNTTTANETTQKILDYPLTLIIPKLDGGAATILKYGQRITIIDAGSTTSSKQLIDEIESLNKTTHQLIITNSKSYRSFGTPYLLIRYDFESFYDNGLLNPDYYELKSPNHLKTDTTLTAGPSTINALVPYDAGRGYALDSSLNSVPLMITHDEVRILYGSDCTITCMEDLDTELLADVYVIPSQGCLDSISLKSISMVKPRLAIIIDNNISECPSQDTLDILDSLSIPYLISSDETIIIHSDGKEVYVQ